MSSALAEFTGIASKDIPIVWNEVSHFIRAGLAEGETETAILSRLLKTECQLWVAFDDEAIIAACVTEIVTIGYRKVCNVISCGGTRMDEWLDISLPAIEAFAKSHHCIAMRFPEIRPGWRRVLKEYRLTKVSLEKELPHGQHH